MKLVKIISEERHFRGSEHVQLFKGKGKGKGKKVRI